MISEVMTSALNGKASPRREGTVAQLQSPRVNLIE